MWKQIFTFELRYQLRQPLFAVSALIFFAIAVALASSDAGTAASESPGTALRNAPSIVVGLMPALSLIGLFAITAFVASGALRDFERRSDMLFFTKPLRKIDYLGGRFAGSMAVSLLVLLAAVVGLLLGSFMPWQPADRLGPFAIAPYLFGLAVIVIPNLLIMGAMFFALAIWSRRLTVTYLCVVFFIGMQDAIEVVAQHLDRPLLGSLLDPSGVVALDTVARYWTIAEQNTRLPDIGGILLANRLLWLGLGLVVLAASIARFDFTTREQRPRRAAKRSRKASLPPPASLHEDPPPQSFRLIAPPRVATQVTVSGRWRQLFRQTRLELTEVIPSTPFLTLLAIGLMFVVVFSFLIGMDNGTPSYPLTHLMLQAIQLGVRLTLLIILAFYAGELVFSQRSLKLSEVYDTLPVPNGVFMAAKLLALVSVAGVFLVAASVSTVAFQLSKGFLRLEPGLYLKGLVVIAWPLLLLVVLAIFLQVLTNHKLAGLLLMAMALLLRVGLPRLGFENNLYLYGGFPAITYSGINGHGHQAEPFLWYMVYWSFGALTLLTATLLLWPRGTEVSLMGRLAVARRRLSMPVLGAASIGFLGMVLTGAWIFHNTHVRSEYLDRSRILQKLADYEQEYRHYRDVTLPRVTSVFAEVDIFPDERQVEIRGRYRLENQGVNPVHTLPITVSPRWEEGVLRVYGGVTLEHLDLPLHQVLVEDEALGFYVLELAQPLRGGEAIDFGFTVRVDHTAFSNSRHNNLVVENGTFFSNRNFFPMIGYSESNQILDPAERRKRGMSAVERAADIGDVAARERNYLGADWIRFEAIVSTRADQIAIAPGDLESQWVEGDRRYFHYKSSTPVNNLLPFLSGAFEVARDRWEDVDIEVYFHPDHAFNIARFIEVTKASLTYMAANFGPYPHDQLRIVEIPGYDGKIAFAFGQVIAFSESWSFTADLDAGELDWLTAILAHEVSHQWWNHQLIPGDAQGATMLGESLAQYSAMMVLEKMYGPEMVRRFLKFHLDHYLKRRGHERVREMPLVQVENQAYIHYSKASLAFYALEDQIGEAALNRALRALLEETAFKGPPFATAQDLLVHLREATPDDKHYLIEDLFETITVFDNRVVAATYAEQPDGTFVVELQTTTMKLRDDGLGETTEMTIDDWVDVGVFGEKRVDGEMMETVLVLEKRRVRSPDGRFEFTVDERPVRAGIDPYNKLIDRDSGDNVRDLVERFRR